MSKVGNSEIYKSGNLEFAKYLQVSQFKVFESCAESEI